MTLVFSVVTSLWHFTFLPRANMMEPPLRVRRIWDPCSVKKGFWTDSSKNAQHMYLVGFSTSCFPWDDFMSVMVSSHHLVWIREFCPSHLLGWSGQSNFHLILCRHSPYSCHMHRPLVILLPFTGPLDFLLPPKVFVFGGKVTWAECIIHKSEEAPLVYVTALWHFSYYLFINIV